MSSEKRELVEKKGNVSSSEDGPESIFIEEIVKPKRPVPLPRSLSSMRFTRKVIVNEKTETRLFYEEQIKRRSRSLGDIFEAQNQYSDGNGYFGLENKSTFKTEISRQYTSSKTRSGNHKGLVHGNPSIVAMSDCVPSPSSDSSYGPSSGSNSSSDSSSSPSCEISLVERLIRTHPVWFLPSLQRSGALHLLQGREMGNFIVRSSTQPLTMAVSVKLPGNHVEHFLLKAVDNRIALENSTHTFQTVHQLIAHYCTLSDEIPVCLRVPNAIAEATTRQQLRSLALLGQEFWTHASNGSGKELSSPSDAEISKNFISSGLGSQSSSSQNSLCDLRKPCRPTTLELSALVSGGSGTPPPVPPRWSRSNLLTPMSLPSSVQSTPSEVQSTFSEKSGRIGKKKKRHSGGKSESIHYKDTEILALFKGTKTNYDDKASDYEDIWSPQYSGKQTPQEPPLRLSTFKPDLIASSLGSEDCLYTQNKLQFQSTPNNNIKNNEQNSTIQINNNKNNRLSFNGTHLQQNFNLNEISSVKENTSSAIIESAANSNGNRDTYTKEKTGKSSLYSEPVDSITFRRFGNYRHSEPNIRWSQPAMMSLVNVDPDFPLEATIKPKTQTIHTGSISSSKLNDLHRGSLANVSVNNGIIPEVTNENKRGNRNCQRNQGVSCASVDNLCHLRDFKRKAKKFSCGVADEGETDEEDCRIKDKEELIHKTVVETGSSKPTIVKPQPAPRKKSTDTMVMKERQEEHNMLEISNNRSWRLDNSWEFVMWEKGEEERMAESNSMKFPVTSQLVSPNNNSNGNLVQHHTFKKLEEVLNDSNGSNTDSHRFSRYDNLESREDCDEGGSVDGDETSDLDRDEKISQPWDSSKWEHLLRLVSESTQQLDSLQLNDNGPHDRHNKNLFQGDETKDHRESRILSESKQRISKILEVSGNVDKASRVISSVVRNLAEKDIGFFGPTLRSFISCTISAKIQDPYKVMRNIRQFISGMKNYLVGVSLESAELRVEIKKQTELLNDCEFLNIDAILEDILVDLVISPLNSHIRGLIAIHHSKLDAHLRISDSPTSAFLSASKETHKLEVLEKLKKIISGFEENISPIKKLDKWNEFVCQVQELENYSSESFLPLLANMLSCVCSSNLPSDVDYMIGLLPHSLADQNNYSLSLLQSAVASLRSKSDRKGSFTLTSVRVIVPDERNGTLIRKMVPIRETTTTKEVAKMVASKVGIANLGDYVLVRIKNGEEKLCPDGDLVSHFLEDGQTALAYKRVDAKIGWPQRIS